MLVALALLGGLALLWAGAEVLVRGAAALGLRFGLTPLAVGLTVVAFGTSAPELAVSVEAALRGFGDLAIGNVVGSNIANVTLILGIAALIRPFRVEAQMIRVEVPLAVGCSLLLVGLLLDQHLSRVEGLLLAAGIVAYTGFSVWEARREGAAVQEELASAAPRPRSRTGLEVLLTIGGLALLVVGADLFIGSAIAVARFLGVSEAMIGLTLVAVGTSLPELATSSVAAWRGQSDIAIGNVVGSNLFNILCILGIAAALRPLALGGVGAADLGFMVGTMALVALFVLPDGRLDRMRGGALVAVYGLYLISLAR